jgi:serine/threonine-protein kinase
MALTPATWRALSELLDEGLEMPEDARARWMDEVHHAHPDLGPTLRKLMAAHSGAAGSDALGTLPSLTVPAGPGEGQRIGPYLLVHRLGAGGMGEVWLARRDDGAFSREVALKLPLLHPLRGDLPARFARERDILARLEHPLIARLYDAGVSQDAQPYLAMERVQGQPITEFADAHRLGVAERLALFAQVLGAVQFAHANLVLHRDLKPSNILVTEAGEVRLLDFGIAKLLDREDGAPDGTLTEGLGRALTPAYASPEQVRGERLSTASDVYALGVVLFELLTGGRPYRLELDSVAQLELAITSAEPLRPSSAVTEETAARRGLTRTRLSRRLAGDLDTVVLKALSKRPEDRYVGVAALAEDLRRHLAGEPVLARPASTLYRVQRFVSRHRAPVAAGTLAAGVLIALTLVALVQARRATLQGRRAEAQARNAEAVRDFLIEVLSAADPALATGAKPPGEVTVREAVDAATGRIGSSLSDQPEAKVNVLGTLAGVYSSLDDVDRSLALLEEGLGVAEKSMPVPNEGQAWTLAQLANTAMFAGRFDVGQRWLDRLEPVLAALHDDHSEVYAQALKMRGNLLRRGNSPDLAGAAAVLERSVAIFRERYPDAEGRMGALFYLAQTLRAANAPARAEAAADEAVAVASSGSSRVRPGFVVANAYSLRAAIRDSNGKLSGADEDYRVAHDGYVRTMGPTNFLTVQNDGLRGFTLLELGNHRAEALALLEGAAETLGRTRRGSNTHAQAVERLGIAYLRLGRYLRASQVLEEDRSLWAERHETVQRTVATVALAEARAELGQGAESGRLLDEALGVLRSSPPSSFHPEAEVHLARGLLALESDDRSGARTALSEALGRSGAETRDDLTRRVLTQAALTRLALASADTAAALAASEAAMQQLRAPQLAELPRIQATALEERGDALCAAGRAQEGEPMLSRAVALLGAVVDPGSPPLLRARLALARCLVDLGRRSEASALAEETRRELEALGTDGATLQPVLRAVQARMAPAH